MLNAIDGLGRALGVVKHERQTLQMAEHAGAKVPGHSLARRCAQDV